MHVQFLSDGSDFRSRSGGGYLAKHRRSSGLFWWTIIITLLLGLAVFCWFFSIMVFRYPEKPFNYKLLSKLKTLEPVKQFTPLTVPHGKFLGAKDLYSTYFYFNAEKLRYTNDTLKRNYILNYTSDSPTYVKGTFAAVRCRPLDKDNLFGPGWVVRAKSVEMEDLQVDLMLPGNSTQPPYKDGEAFTLDNKTTFGTIVHLERVGTDGICASVVPIIYGDYAVGGDQRMDLAPPAKLNVETQWPQPTTADRRDDESVATSKKVAKGS